MKYTIQVIWKMSADIEVDAENMESAQRKAIHEISQYVAEVPSGVIRFLHPSTKLTPDSLHCNDNRCFEGEYAEVEMIQEMWEKMHLKDDEIAGNEIDDEIREAFEKKWYK